MVFQNFFINPINVIALHTLLSNLKFSHIQIHQKVGVVIFTCYYMIISQQKHFLKGISVKNFNIKMLLGSRHYYYCHTQEILNQFDEK